MGCERCAELPRRHLDRNGVCTGWDCAVCTVKERMILTKTCLFYQIIICVFVKSCLFYHYEACHQQNAINEMLEVVQNTSFSKQSVAQQSQILGERQADFFNVEEVMVCRICTNTADLRFGGGLSKALVNKSTGGTAVALRKFHGALCFILE